MNYLTRITLASFVAKINNKRVFSITNNIYRDNQYFNSKTFFAIIILNRFYFKENYKKYR